MVDQHDHDRAGIDRRVDVDQRRAMGFQRGRQAVRIGLDDSHARTEPFAELLRDAERRALAEVVDIRLEREAQARDRRAGMRLDQRGGLGNDVVGLAVVDQSGGADQRRVGGIGMDQEPGID